MKVPEGFKTVPMGELVERVAKTVDVQRDTLYRQIGIRSHGKGLFYKKPVLGKELGNKRVFWVEPNCFIVNIVFAWEQAVGRTTKNDKGKIVSHRFPMYRPKNGQCDVDFLAYLFKTRYGKHILTLASPGGAGRNKTLGQAEFLKTEIVVPPAPEQKKIADILSTWDRAIETVEKLIANSQAQKKALMQQLLTGKKRLPGFDGKWAKVTLDKIADIFMGSSPKSAAYNDLGRGIPLLQGNADIRKRVSAPRVFTSQITKECMPEDILLSVRAPVGEVSRSIHHACIGRGLAAIRAKDKTSQNFLYQWLLFFEPKWERFSQGSTFEAVNSSDVKTLHIDIPQKREEQTVIANILNSADKETESLIKTAKTLKKEKSALMQQLLTGKRRVKIERANNA